MSQKTKAPAILPFQRHSHIWKYCHWQAKGRLKCENNFCTKRRLTGICTNNLKGTNSIYLLTEIICIVLVLLKYNKQHIIPLENVRLTSVPDEGSKNNSSVMISLFAKLWYFDILPSEDQACTCVCQWAKSVDKFNWQKFLDANNREWQWESVVI